MRSAQLKKRKIERKTKSKRKKKRERKPDSEPEDPTEKPTSIGKYSTQHAPLFLKATTELFDSILTEGVYSVINVELS
jgi:hypothetical protein